MPLFTQYTAIKVAHISPQTLNPVCSSYERQCVLIFWQKLLNAVICGLMCSLHTTIPWIGFRLMVVKKKKNLPNPETPQTRRNGFVLSQRVLKIYFVFCFFLRQLWSQFSIRHASAMFNWNGIIDAVIGCQPRRLWGAWHSCATYNTSGARSHTYTHTEHSPQQTHAHTSPDRNESASDKKRFEANTTKKRKMKPVCQLLSLLFVFSSLRLDELEACSCALTHPQDAFCNSDIGKNTTRFLSHSHWPLMRSSGAFLKL